MLTAITAAVGGAAYFGLLIYTLYQLRRPTSTGYWLAAVCGWSLVFSLALTLDSLDIRILGFAPGIWLCLVSLGGICLLGALTFSYLGLTWGWAWLPALLPIAVVVLIIDVVDPAAGLGELTWRVALGGLGVSAWTAAAAWLLVGLLLLAVTFRETSKAHLPLFANRGLFWALMLPVLMFGEGLAVWAPEYLAALGQLVRVVAIFLMAYAAISQNLVDVRGVFRGFIGNALFIIVTAVISLLGIASAVYIFQRNPDQGWAFVIPIALALALVYQAVRSLLDQIIKETVFKSGYDTAAIAAEYSKSVAQILDIHELAATIGQALVQSVEATKFGLLLLTPYRENVRAEVFVGSGSMPTVGHRFLATSLFLHALTHGRKPVLQYTLDVADQFRSVVAIDRRWLQRLGSDVYVPILDGENLTGVLAIGPRKSRDPYRARDLELLQAIADQTAVALANARLVTDLKASNDEVRALNETLADTNEQLKEMDRVKTDFITIASHELRTPLTQILGYADLLSMMSEAEQVSGPELSPITGSVLKAGNRLNDIVTQMLEVSQMDVDAIQLTLEETTIDAALHTALEPFDNAWAERRIVLTANGIRALPPLTADAQRLSQALRQVVSNAIKFTPDGGSIEVRGRLVKDRANPDMIEICVADTGVGIEAKHLELIFEKFFRVGSTTSHSTGSTKFMGAGPGLGLAIARGIVLAHGGRIWAESPGHDPEHCPGSEIYILLPLKPVVPPSAGAPNSPATAE
jgi:signal transduction histidine kinase